MSEMPTAVIMVPEPAMAGLAVIANEPERFQFPCFGWSSGGSA
jgi:hypothetical protein